MNFKKLKEAESIFFREHPEGFNSEEMLMVEKKHKINKISDFVKESFTKDNYEEEKYFDYFCDLVKKSSMVSMFEKMKFRDSIVLFKEEDREVISKSIYNLIYDDEKEGFESLVNCLLKFKLAKWPIVTCILVYYNLDEDILIKPNTVKGIIKYFELENIKYNSLPSYEFYYKYRNIINEMKMNVDKSLSPNNATFSGFLMMSI